MTTYEETYKQICRLCLSQSDSKNMICLITSNNWGKDLSNHGKAVLTFAQVSVHPEDNLPKYMCHDCLYLLKQAILFKFTCENTDKELKALSKLYSSNSDTLQKNIVEYSIYKLYFPTSSNSIESRKDANEIKIEVEDNFALKDTSINVSNEIYINNEAADFSNDIINNQNNTTDSEMETNSLQYADDILAKIEKMIGVHPDSVNGSFKQCNKKKKFKRNKLCKRVSPTNDMTYRKNLSVKRQNTHGALLCKICHKMLANQHTYEHHMQRHNGCRFICEHCGKGFPVHAELQIHLVARHGTGRYLECQHCSFKAPRKFDLIEHMRIHTGERPYTCDKCGLTFRRRGIWKKHFIYHMEKKVQCIQCPRKFYQRSEMLAHANNVHNRLYMYSCCKCGATYAKPATVRRHLLERHGIPREVQGKVIRVNKGSSCHDQ